MDDEKQPWAVRSRAMTFVAANRAVTAATEKKDFILRCRMAVARWLDIMSLVCRKSCFDSIVFVGRPGRNAMWWWSLLQVVPRTTFTLFPFESTEVSRDERDGWDEDD